MEVTKMSSIKTSLILALLTVILLFESTTAQIKRYIDYKVFTIKIKTEAQLQRLKDLEADGGYNFWKNPSSISNADVMVPPDRITEYNNLISELQLDHKLKINNVQE